MSYQAELEQAFKSGKLSKEVAHTMMHLHESYAIAAKSNGYSPEECEKLFEKMLQYMLYDRENPYAFEPFHVRIRKPIDYYAFGLDFIRPIVVFDQSRILHPERIDQIEHQLAQGDNVVLLANHQTELDPQAISLLLEKNHPQLAEEMIFVAGHRVVSDFLAIPFSKGRNLLCIFSKKYIEDDPSLKEQRRMHNQRTMILMAQLLSEGGKCIYVAPSGGRDRTDSHGKPVVAHFDAASIEMFWLMAQRAERPTHFYPLALATYNLLPPPASVKKKLGESRVMKATPIHLAFGQEIDMEHFPGSDKLDKKQKRKARGHYIWEEVRRDYEACT